MECTQVIWIIKRLEALTALVWKISEPDWRLEYISKFMTLNGDTWQATFARHFKTIEGYFLVGTLKITDEQWNSSLNFEVQKIVCNILITNLCQSVIKVFQVCFTNVPNCK